MLYFMADVLPVCHPLLMLEDNYGVDHQTFGVPSTLQYSHQKHGKSAKELLSYHPCQDIVALYWQGLQRVPTAVPGCIILNIFINLSTIILVDNITKGADIFMLDLVISSTMYSGSLKN